MSGKTCDRCGCTMRKVRPPLIFVNGEAFYPDEPGCIKEWKCPACGGHTIQT